MSFGQRLLLLLEEKNISQKQFAEKISVPYTTFNGYIKDKREPDFGTLKQIAKHLSTSVDYLLELTNSPDIKPNSQLSTEEISLLDAYKHLHSDYKELLLEQSKLLLKHNNKKDKPC